MQGCDQNMNFESNSKRNIHAAVKQGKTRTDVGHIKNYEIRGHHEVLENIKSQERNKIKQGM